MSSATSGLRTVSVKFVRGGIQTFVELKVNLSAPPSIVHGPSQLFRAVELPPPEDAAAVVPALREILADHTTALDPRTDIIDTLCVHLPGYGTRSSSIVTVDASRRLRYWHAPGPPCVTEYSELL